MATTTMLIVKRFFGWLVASAASLPFWLKYSLPFWPIEQMIAPNDLCLTRFIEKLFAES